ncbi:ATP-binding cassette domain-containing protein [Mumia flava]|uniref:ATP-binding cassette domain-containing protein n=1 Tax=Mumia flava TaxID=1348852 RepID=UPI001476E008|nr:ABC transporter ATP-binding protein [Mumia flava]
MASLVVEARGLRLDVAGTAVVRDVDLEVRSGEVVGLVGAGGAGTSALLAMLATATRLTSGHLSVLGLDPAVDGPRIRGRTGVATQHDSLDPRLRARAELSSYARCFGYAARAAHGRADAALAFAGLTDRARTVVGRLTRGERRRLQVARAFVNDPELVLLDEPTAGCSPRDTDAIGDLVLRMRASARAVVLATHSFEEAERVCDRVLVMDAGRVLVEGAPSSLLAGNRPSEVVEVRTPCGADGAALAVLGDLVDRVEVHGDRVLAYTSDGLTVAERAVAGGLAPDGTRVRPVTPDEALGLLADDEARRWRSVE